MRARETEVGQLPLPFLVENLLGIFHNDYVFSPCTRACRGSFLAVYVEFLVNLVI